MEHLLVQYLDRCSETFVTTTVSYYCSSL